MVKVCLVDKSNSKMLYLDMEAIPRIGESVTIMEEKRTTEYIVTDVKTTIDYTAGSKKNQSNASVDYIVMLSKKEEYTQQIFPVWKNDKKPAKINAAAMTQ